MSVLGPYTYRLDAGPAPARELARRVARAQPDAMLHAGVRSGARSEEPPAFALVRELSDRFGGRLLILGTDSWADGPSVFAALGRKVHEMYSATRAYR